MTHVPRRITRTRVARLVGASALAVLGQFAVDMPEGWFGAQDAVTLLGWIYSGLVVLATGVEGFGQFLGRGRASVLTPIIYSVNIGVFVPALASDPTIAGIVVVWQLVSLARHFLDRTRPMAIRRFARLFDPEEPARQWLARFGPAVRHLALVSLVAWLGVIGYGLAQRHWVTLVVCTTLNVLAAIPAARFLWLLFRGGRRSAVAAWLPLAAAALFVTRPSIALTLLAIHQLMVLWFMLRHSPPFQEVLRHFYEQPALFVAYTFGALILLGTVLLTFPAAAPAGAAPIAPLDAFFTATSAVCVTGLIVVDTPVAFSTFGHAVILGLIQVGGLGIMVLSTFAAVLLGGRLGLRGEHALGEYLELPGADSAIRLAVFIVTTTFAVEAAGAAALFVSFTRLGLSAGEATWHAVFHSVSAFCNAGFALQTDSLVAFREDPYTLGVFGTLIFLGGIGFAVLSAAWFRMTRRGAGRVPVQVKLVLAATAVLVVLGWGLYALVEWDASLAGLSAADRVSNALFQSVTLRTAGFNSVPFGSVRTPTALMMMIWMFIGAAPGGTGGGIKVTTAALLLGAIPAIARGETRVTIFGRRVPQDVIYRCAAIAVISLLVACAALFVLALSHRLPFEQLAFEVFSAIGTVGLSLGVTPLLDPLGKYVVILAMFVGRTGPLTLALTLGRGSARHTSVPEEGVAVG